MAKTNPILESTNTKMLEGSVSVVTGGSRGIGEKIAKTLAENGSQVVVVYRANSEKANTVVQEIEDEGGESYAIQSDVSDALEVQKLMEEVIDRFGKIDILVNNAGITRDRTFRKLTIEEWNEVIAVNLNSVFLTTSAVINHMLENKHGRIINVSSIIGQTGGFGQSNYAASKSGMVGLTKSLALETATNGVTVNAVLPGFVETEMVAEMPRKVLDNIVSQVPMKRLGQPREIAEAVLYLTQAEYITGQSLHINGGLFM